MNDHAPPGRSPLKDPLLALALAAGPAGAWAWVSLTGFTGSLSGSGLTALLLLLLLSPVLEELVFRGLIQGWLLERPWARRRFGPLSVANLLSAAAFALSHWPRGGLLQVSGVLWPGLVFGYFRERHGRLATPVLLHAWYNSCLLFVAW
ncbi:MAG: JDVT-CTERM system CAAX-type protease [Chromatiales bacterium]|nr:JDVT-CTERM system CAAX-type protease [Chromatiales bacterium]